MLFSSQEKPGHIYTAIMGSLLQDTTLMRFQGTNIQVEGTPYLLTQLVSEKVNVYDNERIGVFYAQRETDMLDAVIKMHIQYVQTAFFTSHGQSNQYSNLDGIH